MIRQPVGIDDDRENARLARNRALEPRAFRCAGLARQRRVRFAADERNVWGSGASVTSAVAE